MSAFCVYTCGCDLKYIYVCYMGLELYDTQVYAWVEPLFT